jgi:hypothetical protein
MLSRFTFSKAMIHSQGRRVARDVSQHLRGRWLSAAARITTDSRLRKQGLTPTRPPSEKRSPPPSYSGRGRPGGSSDSRSLAQSDKRQGNGEGEQKRLLKPYDLSMQLKRMCSEGDLNGAIERLKTTPRDAQNAAVWNTMISECLSAERYQLSYELFVDVSVYLFYSLFIIMRLCDR